MTSTSNSWRASVRSWNMMLKTRTRLGVCSLKVYSRILCYIITYHCTGGNVSLLERRQAAARQRPSRRLSQLAAVPAPHMRLHRQLQSRWPQTRANRQGHVQGAGPHVRTLQGWWHWALEMAKATNIRQPSGRLPILIEMAAKPAAPRPRRWPRRGPRRPLLLLWSLLLLLSGWIWISLLLAQPEVAEVAPSL